MQRVIFVADAGHVNAAVSGGVQVCTREYIDLFTAAQFEVELFTVTSTRRFLPRVKARLGIEVYERYDFDLLIKPLLDVIERTGARTVALNQLMLIKFAPLLRKKYGKALTIVVLSHGNESGDFLHEVTRTASRGTLARVRDIFRLGALIQSESSHFIADVDHVLVLSETELEINKWLGAKSGFFVPRTFCPVDIGWSPRLKTAGFVGSLNHKPNYDGLVALLEALEGKAMPDFKVRVVGGPPDVGRALAVKYPVVEYVGHVSDTELVKEAASWAVFLNPVFWYSRGASTKLATAINWGLPVVSTPAGNRGYTWREGNLVTVETPEEMAAAVVSIAGTGDEIARLARETRRIATSGPTLAQLGAALRSRLQP